MIVLRNWIFNMFTDTHCHLYGEYYEDISSVIQKAEEVGISRFFVAGCNQKSNEEVLNVIHTYSNVYGCLGIHPEEVELYTEEDLEFLENNLLDEKVIAIGEIGLDYHYTKVNKEKQKQLFGRQLELAQEYHLPVVIHSREATEDTIAMLKKYPNVKGVIHSFSGSAETARIYIKMGYKLGINGVVTFKNSHLKDAVLEVLDSIVFETDSPYLTPHPFRGTKNEPKYVFNIATFVSEISGKSLEELSEITNKNIKEIFDKC